MKPYKKSITVLLFCVATLFCGNVDAQSLQSLLKSVSGILGSSKTEQKAESKTEIPAAEQLQGRWIYNSPDMIYTGDSTIASVAVASAKTQMSTVAEKSGLVAGRDYIEIGSDGIAKLVSGERSATASYNYRPEEGKMSVGMEHEEKRVSLTADVTVVDDKLRIMFDAAQLVAEAEKNSDELKKNTYFQMLKTLTEKYPGIMVGATFGK